MGIFATICFEKTGELEFERPFPQGFEIAEISDLLESDFLDPDSLEEAAPGATHCIETSSRYYGIGYERGNWTKICSVLMLLHACEGVGRVWYGGDNHEILLECSINKVLALSRHFMTYGERPYRNAFKQC